MRVLFCTCSPARYMAPPQLGDEQINCGPFFRDVEIGGRYLSLATPLGDYDLAGIAARLPPEQAPDVVACLVDSSWLSTPRNLAAFRCPKVLLLADTHHMRNPVLGMLEYAASQPFNRVVVLYTRHHLEIFRAAGMKNLHWLPALTLPYRDAPLQASRQAERQPRIALVGQSGTLHQRRLRLAGALAAQKLPLVLREGSQAEAIAFYGSSLIGLNVTANGDLNLRAFETMGCGAMLLMDQLAPESGVTDLWQDGREFVSYRSPGELVERAKYYLEHPDEAGAIAAAGARWYDAHCNEKLRRTAFRELVWEGHSRPEFAVAPARRHAAAVTPTPAIKRELLLAYQLVQQLHSTAETVHVVFDETVPDGEFGRTFTTLPRVQLSRITAARAPGAVPIDLFVCGAGAAFNPAACPARYVWFWNAGPNPDSALRSRLHVAGLKCFIGSPTIFGRPAAAAEDERVHAMRMAFLNGQSQRALAMAGQFVAEQLPLAEPSLVIAEIAFEAGNVALAQRMLRRAQVFGPNEPRVLLTQLAISQEDGRQRHARRLAKLAARCFDQGEPGGASFARAALEIAPELAEAHHLLGLFELQLKDAAEADFAAGFASLRRATQLAPDRVEFWQALAAAARCHGFFDLATGAYEQVVRLAAHDALAWFGLGEARLASGRPDLAVAAFARGLEVEPGDRQLAGWLQRARSITGVSAASAPPSVELRRNHAETGMAV